MKNTQAASSKHTKDEGVIWLIEVLNNWQERYTKWEMQEVQTPWCHPSRMSGKRGRNALGGQASSSPLHLIVRIEFKIQTP